MKTKDKIKWIEKLLHDAQMTLDEVKAEQAPQPPFWGWFGDVTRPARIARAYDTNDFGYVCDNTVNGFNTFMSLIRLATPEEVKSHLIELFWQKYKEGDGVKSLVTGRNRLITADYQPFRYIARIDGLFYNGTEVYKGGKWADKVEDKNQKHAEALAYKMKEFMVFCNLLSKKDLDDFTNKIKTYLDEHFRPE